MRSQEKCLGWRKRELGRQLGPKGEGSRFVPHLTAGTRARGLAEPKSLMRASSQKAGRGGKGHLADLRFENLWKSLFNYWQALHNSWIKVSRSLDQVIIMAYQHVLTYHLKWKQMVTIFIEINVRDLHKNLWSLKIEGHFFFFFNINACGCYVMETCLRGYKVKTRDIFSCLLLPVCSLKSELHWVPGPIKALGCMRVGMSQQTGQECVSLCSTQWHAIPVHGTWDTSLWGVGSRTQLRDPQRDSATTLRCNNKLNLVLKAM